MVAVPPEPTVVTTPVAEPTLAIAVLLLVHEPPGVVLLSVAVEPWQPTVGPVIADGVAITVTVYGAAQPVDVEVNVTVVVPAAIPVV